MTARRHFSSIGVLLRNFQCRRYWEKDGKIAIYRFYRYRWYAPDPDGGYTATGRTTGSVEGCHCIEFASGELKMEAREGDILLVIVRLCEGGVPEDELVKMELPVEYLKQVIPEGFELWRDDATRCFHIRKEP